MAKGCATFTPQEESSASLAPKLTKAQGAIRWDAPAEEIARFVRAMDPWPGATTRWCGSSLRVCAAAMAEASEPTLTASPGTILRVTSTGVVVATGHGALEVTQVQPAGRRRMSVREFLAGHPMQVGERLG